MNLTPRQAQIVERCAMGDTAEEIAAGFGRSAETVRTQIKMAKERVGAKTIPHLVAISISKGFIQTLCLSLTLAMLVGADDGIRNRQTQRVVRRQEVAAIYA